MATYTFNQTQIERIFNLQPEDYIKLESKLTSDFIGMVINRLVAARGGSKADWLMNGVTVKYEEDSQSKSKRIHLTVETLTSEEILEAMNH